MASSRGADAIVFCDMWGVSVSRASVSRLRRVRWRHGTWWLGLRSRVAEGTWWSGKRGVAWACPWLNGLEQVVHRQDIDHGRQWAQWGSWWIKVWPQTLLKIVFAVWIKSCPQGAWQIGRKKNIFEFWRNKIWVRCHNYYAPLSIFGLQKEESLSKFNLERDLNSVYLLQPLQFILSDLERFSSGGQHESYSPLCALW